MASQKNLVWLCAGVVGDMGILEAGVQNIRLSWKVAFGTMQEKEWTNMESQVELKAANERNAGTFKRLMPEIAEPYTALNQEVYKDGVVSGKNKRLMALVGALVEGCRACILYQTEEALKQGASVDEILETCSVALALGGTMGMGEITRVMAYLRERDLLPG